MDCNNQLSYFNNQYLPGDLFEEIVKDYLGSEDVQVLSATSKELHNKVSRLRKKLFIDPTTFDQHFPRNVFEQIVKKYLDPEEVINLSVVSKELHRRIKHDFFLEKIFFDTNNGEGISRLNNYLTQATKMNVGVVVSLSSVANTEVWDVIYSHLDSIRALDLSACTPRRQALVGDVKNVKDLLPETYPNEDWVKGMYEGKKFKFLVLPEGVNYTEEQAYTTDKETKPEKKGRLKKAVKVAKTALNPKNVFKKK